MNYHNGPPPPSIWPLFVAAVSWILAS
ncbi:CYSTM domain-containing protein, partial [Psidium guajava]